MNPSLRIAVQVRGFNLLQFNGKLTKKAIRTICKRVLQPHIKSKNSFGHLKHFVTVTEVQTPPFG